jgi:RNA polymerase-binding transcription factor DksA
MNDITRFKERLEEEKTKLEGELQTVGRRNPSNPADWEAVPQETGMEADPNDQADQMEHYGENAAILNDLEIRYNDVLAALSRIEKGTYGVCETGNEEIESERLNADPAARTCKEHLNS